MTIEIKNCNNIDTGEIYVNEKSLNVFYAINGTGKSTIAKAIAAKSAEDLNKLQPFKYRESDDSNISLVTGVDAFNTIQIFDEKHVSQYFFKPDELIQNSFDIFVKTPDYVRQLQIIEGLIKDTKNLFANNPELDELINDFSFFITAFGKEQKTGYSAASQLGKSFNKGNKVHNVPEELKEYKDYIQKQEDGLNSKWVKWHNDGNKFFNDVAHQCQCPYCALHTNDEVKKQILKVSEEFDPKAVEHLAKIIEVFKRLAIYFADETNAKINDIATNVSGVSTEQKNFLLEIKAQVDTLKDKLWKIKSMSFHSLKDAGKIVNEISELKIDLNYFSHLNSPFSQSKIDDINIVLDAILQKATNLQKAIGEQNSTIKRTIGKNSAEINSFLAYAGYDYSVALSEDEQGNHKLKLQHRDMDSVLTSADGYLSFGERNAFALVLFMYQTIKENPDLIILDDPISSFDGHKKFAVLNKLFLETNSFKGKTVILLTHEFSTVIDTVYNMQDQFNSFAYHIENRDGTLIVQPIDVNDIKPFSVIARENINSTNHKVIKLIYLRRLLDVEGTRNAAWQLLSNVFKPNRMEPIYKDTDTGIPRPMTEDEINDATTFIMDYVSDFDYATDYSAVQDKLLILALYRDASSNYERLMLYRIINNDKEIINNNVIRKFYNETFHAENDYIFQLNPLKYEIVPPYVIRKCNEDIRKHYPNDLRVGVNAPSHERRSTSIKTQIRLYELPASAGSGYWIDDASHIDILVSGVVCDYATYISGDSMEPDIPDRSIVLVKHDSEIKMGDTCIFNFNGNIYCKKLGDSELLSVNSKYPPIPFNEYDDLRSQGKVVKIISPNDVIGEIDFIGASSL